MRLSLTSAVVFLLTVAPLFAQQKFSQTVGNVSVAPVRKSDPISVPFITWGGDVATFQANGGLTTTSGSTFQQMGLNIQLTNGDDFVGQVKDYVSGKTPFLRGTFRMLGQASEVLGSNPNTKPVVIMQLSWSAGDHIVSRDSIKTLNDLRPANGKKVKIACQTGGPHVGLLYDSLSTANVSRNDIEIVWCDELTGPNGPAEIFRKGDADACCVITPDMIGLTGGVDSRGDGSEGTVEGARVLNSTQSMSRSIADVYAVRSDWYRENKEFVEKFVAGYLKSAAQVVSMRNDFESSGQLKPEYRQVLTLSQKILGEEVLPTLEVDAHGLLLDCTFVNLSGQGRFFESKGNLDGFEGKMKSALDMATSWGYASSRMGFDPPGLDYTKLGRLGGLEYKQPAAGVTERFEDAEGFENFGNEELDENTIVSLTIEFEVNDTNFSSDRYGAEFKRAIQAASTFGNAAVVIRGHADPTKALAEFVKGGIQRKVLKVTGQRGNRKYWLQNGAKLDLNQTEQVIKLIQTGAFETPDHQPRQIVQAALNLSKKRADAVKNSLVDYAKSQDIDLDASQIKPVGAGISDPVVGRPLNREQAAANRRVEFRIVRVPAEAVSADDFDF